MNQEFDEDREMMRKVEKDHLEALYMRLKELSDENERLRAAAGGEQGGEGWRHKKRGTIYTMIGTGRVQSELPLSDMDPVVVYQGQDGQLWARRITEFYDGRFERG